jgi:transposase InsO family protein
MISDPDRIEVVSLIQEASQAGCRLAVACREIGISLRTLQRWQVNGHIQSDARQRAARTPTNKLSDAERKRILAVANSAEFASLPPSQIVPTLADRGEYLASESTFYRVLRQAGQQQHRGRTRAPRRRPVSTHQATSPNQLWCWDITYLPSAIKGQYFYWYMMMDVFSRKIVAHEVHPHEGMLEASQLLRRASLAEGRILQPLVLHADNGAAMKGSTMLATMQQLGVVASFSRPRVSNDNAYAESLFRTCKYRPGYPNRPFAGLEEARQWVEGFVRWYNHEHKHSGLNFVTPQQRHQGLAEQVLNQRKQVYEEAKARQPKRWSGATRNWVLGNVVWLNPERAMPDSIEVAA